MPVPAEDEPSRTETKALARCDSEALYYGIGIARDFHAARRCAYGERRSRASPVIGGSAVLMMLYGNAKGVRRNIELASKFACELGGSGFELEARLTRLESWRTIRESRELDVCDDITSGYMDGFCTRHRERVAALARNERKAAARRGLPEPELSRLERAARTYFDARAAHEVDLSGSSRAAFQIAERAALEDAFVEALERAQKPGFPPGVAATAADAELDAIYATIMKCESHTERGGLAYGTVQRKDVRATQRLWLSFREAWVALGAKLRPEAAPAAFRGWLARERTKALSELATECERSEK